MSARNKTFASIVALGLGGVGGAFALLVGNSAGDAVSAPSPLRPIWTEVQWPFPVDQWGRGKALECRAANCGAEIRLYLRAKIGFCNCTTGVADDADLDRMGDLELVAREASPRGDGRPITVAWMKGRSRAYTLTATNAPGKTAISVAFNDRCDMIVATAVLPHDRTATIEPGVMEFLNSGTVLHWAEVTLAIARRP